MDLLFGAICTVLPFLVLALIILGSFRSWRNRTARAHALARNPKLAEDAAVFEVEHAMERNGSTGLVSIGLLFVRPERAVFVRGTPDAGQLELPIACALGEVSWVPGRPLTKGVPVELDGRRPWFWPVASSRATRLLWDIWITLAEQRRKPELLQTVPSYATGWMAHAPAVGFAFATTVVVAGWALREAFASRIPPELLFAGSFVAIPVGAFAGALVRSSRNARVFFYADRILILWKKRVALLRYDDLAGYRDASADYVRLVRKRGLVRSADLAIPTPSERARVAVLSVLDGRGVPRID
jgi:hypothetical protein